MKLLHSILSLYLTLSSLCSLASGFDDNFENNYPDQQWNSDLEPPQKPMYYPLDRNSIALQKEGLDILDLKNAISEINEAYLSQSSRAQTDLLIRYKDEQGKVKYAISGVHGHLFIAIWTIGNDYVVEFTTHSTCKQLESLVFNRLRQHMMEQLLTWAKGNNYGYAIQGDLLPHSVIF